MNTTTESEHRYKDPDLVAEVLLKEGVLLCGAKGCALALPSPLAPAVAGWELHHGWWLCLTHSGGQS